MPYNIAIVDGGIAGLYSALLLQREGHKVHIFEASNRVGGRIFMHYFTGEKNQFFDAGAMIIPGTNLHCIVSSLTSYINSSPSLPSDMQLSFLRYPETWWRVRMLVNGYRQDWWNPGILTPSMVNWPVPDTWESESADDRLIQAMGSYIADLYKNFDDTFNVLLTLDAQYGSFRKFVGSTRGKDRAWPDAFIDFVETVCFETNAFELSCAEIILRRMEYNLSTSWKIVNGGADRLTEAMATLVGWDSITLGARVNKGSFDKVILAIPPAALEMIYDRPRWSPDKETALRAMHFEPAYKMGLRFKTRWWDRVDAPRVKVGESITDLPVRLIHYPPILDEQNLKDEPGTLVIAAAGADTRLWLPLSPTARRSLALRCLAQLYSDKADIDVYAELIDTFDVVWSERCATGTAAFLPGQFARYLQPAKRAEGNIFFAGEHLSRRHGWMTGALESALDTVRDLLGSPDLAPLSRDDNKTKTDTQSATAIAAAVPTAEVNFNDIPPVGLPFEFYPKDPMFPGGVGVPLHKGWGAHRGARVLKDLGTHDGFANGIEVAYLVGPNA
ncbi:hypothetical protein EWM64_g6304 [Hericium alpestre]|uniref:Amine oxidase domain-containing protein n=1 Tax=Hericium alpestre TaxID=135208 RepID=A0A4Y9ZW44_9AGAM|nr:hypothetical protein EWM64_g6304 [Hericium alpestre]